jgi:hypothetical protein
MRLSESTIDIDDVRRQIEQQWSQKRGAMFATVAANGTVWNITVFAYNRTDCWARKAGTKGEQRRTFCRFSTRDDSDWYCRTTFYCE